MAQVSTVMWDVGGVLLTNGWDHLQRYEVLDYFKLSREPFETVHAQLNDSWEKGFITVEQYLEKTVFYEPRSFTPEEFLAKMKEQSLVHPNTALGLLKQVAESEDLAVAMLNNEYFDCFVSSCYVGLRKPLPEIYKMALDLLQRDPAEVVFIDDREGNIATAKGLGMHGIVHTTAARTAEELGRLGVVVTA